MQKTTMLKKEQAMENKKWYIIDATDLILGRLSTNVANLLRGKNKTSFTPNVDCGDYVIIINTEKIKLSGNKLENENKYNHSGYIGGLRVRSLKTMKEKYSDELVRNAIKNMLPKNKLSNQIITKLHLYKNDAHNHQAQKPIEYKITY
ncbi:MAG: 50S ribosomal protein L13 [Mycoplasmoidaceae bacterium]